MKLPNFFSIFNSKTSFKKIFSVDIKGYFVGILLMPWIWNFGFFGILTFFLQLYLSSPDLKNINSSLTTTFNKEIVLADVWNLVLFILIANYSIAYFVRQKLPRLSNILFLTTLLILFYLTSLSIPFFRESLRNN